MGSVSVRFPTAMTGETSLRSRTVIDSHAWILLGSTIMSTNAIITSSFSSSQFSSSISKLHMYVYLSRSTRWTRRTNKDLLSRIRRTSSINIVVGCSMRYICTYICEFLEISRRKYVCSTLRIAVFIRVSGRKAATNSRRKWLVAFNPFPLETFQLQMPESDTRISLFQVTMRYATMERRESDQIYFPTRHRFHRGGGIARDTRRLGQLVMDCRRHLKSTWGHAFQRQDIYSLPLCIPTTNFYY